MSGLAAGPARDCALCPRLVAYREENAAKEPDWWNAPVPAFGALDARLFVVGLAPGRMGANRTGRPFTGDYAGDLLYPSLLSHGFAQGTYDRRADDGLSLIDCRITNAVRCVPPENKPTGGEAKACRPFLVAELSAAPRLCAVLALGRIAHDAVCATLGVRAAEAPFAHGARHELALGGRAVALFDSYHCSRYNLNTRRLTADMFNAVLADIRAHLQTASAAVP